MEQILKGATIIDVRTPNEYIQENYPGAVNIPLNEVSFRWSIIRILRLVVGAIGTVHGVTINELAMSLLAFLLFYMAIDDTDCGNVYEVELNEANPQLKEAEYEKVGRIL